MYGRNITCRLGRSHARANIPAILELMRTGALEPERVTAHLGALDRADVVVRDHVLGEVGWVAAPEPGDAEERKSSWCAPSVARLSADE